MKLIRFDHRGAMHPDQGITDERWGQCLAVLEPIRDAMQIDGSDAMVQYLPDTVLRNYRLDPVNSELAGIFGTANRLHDEVDAVVVLGTDDLASPAKTLMDALCHPYHNELTRAGRGSKPRIYFCGSDFDNDARQALLQRLADGGYRDDPAERRWVVCPISNQNSPETAVSVGQFGKCTSGVIPILSSNDRLQSLADASDCRRLFTIPAKVDGPWLVFSAAGLLPAALLGIDCVQLMEGAIAMNRHFTTTTGEDNMVLRHAAIQHLLVQRFGESCRILTPWDQSLRSLVVWYNRLAEQNPLPLQPKHPSDHVAQTLFVEGCRSDRLIVEDVSIEHPQTLVDRLRDSYRATIDRRQQANKPTTELILPEIDPHTIGQLMQLLILSSLMEKRLDTN